MGGKLSSRPTTTFWDAAGALAVDEASSPWPQAASSAVAENSSYSGDFLHG